MLILRVPAHRVLFERYLSQCRYQDAYHAAINLLYWESARIQDVMQPGFMILNLVALKQNACMRGGRLLAASTL